MASYIELDKQSSFPPSSNVGKVIFGVDSNGNITLTNSSGETIPIGSLPYLEYVSKISRIGVNSPKTSYLLNNTLNINPIWERVSSGNFRFKFDNEIDIDKTISNVPLINTPFSYGITNELNPSNNFKLGFNNSVISIAIQSNEKILVGGEFTTYNGTNSNYIIRLNSDGSVDNTFLSIDDGFDDRVSSIAIQSDGKILIGGQFTTYNGTNSNYIIRLNSDGSVDNTFLSIDNGFDDVVSSIAIQSDGKILVGGYFTTYNGTNSNYIIRLNSNGSSGFIGGFDDIVTSIAIQSNGKILVGGKFSTYNGTNSNYIIRLNSDGSVDNTFLSIDNGFDSTVNSIAIQDGKILVGGGFNSYNGTNSNCIIRLNSDGSVDNTFLSIDDGFDSQVNTIAIQSDGKILVGGGFTSYNGTNSNYIIRLNSDGSVDNTFLSIDNGFDDYVNYITIQSNGKILVGGNFTTYNGTGSNRIIRLNSDGIVQYGFDDTFLDNQVSTIAIQSDGNVLVGGSFNSIDNVNYLAKFDNEFFYNLTGDDNFVNQPIEIKVYN
jgi:uncharacterized delta-60 repeat protein